MSKPVNRGPIYVAAAGAMVVVGAAAVRPPAPCFGFLAAVVAGFLVMIEVVKRVFFALTAPARGLTPRAQTPRRGAR